MDYSSVDSEIIDSLEILSPRVKRFYENTHENKTNVHRGKILNVYRDDSEYLTGHTGAAHGEKTAASSTSLILKKTSQREILKKYSILSYTSLLRANRHPGSDHTATAKDKPLIKVTVIPKSQGQGKSHKRRQHTKRIHNTVSNHENSIHTKNLYLVVAGRNKEKVYEIKTTGSANFSADAIECHNHYEDSPLRERSNIKAVIQSLNMDKKKKKGKNKKESKKTSVEAPEIEGHNDCKCMCTREFGRNDDGKYVDGKRSRVRIFGQVGLTEDERYILKCDATLDGEPIMTRFDSERIRPPQYHITDDSEPIKYRTNYNTMACYDGYCGDDTYRRDLKDSNIQVDFGNNRNTMERMFRSMENQGTQVNFSVCPSRTMLPTKKNQTIQCNYANIPKTINITENGSEHKMIHDCQSPLVIISVYPKQEPSNDVKNTNQHVDTNVRPSSPRQLTYTSQEVRTARTNDCCRNFQRARKERTPTRSRTPSPARKNDTQRRKDVQQTDKKLPRTRPTSPIPSPTRSNRPMPNREQKKTSSKRIIDDDTFTCNNMKKIHQILTSRGLKKTNTEIKKAIVDDYTRRITESMNRYSEVSPKHDTSKVKINIDSENEYYDVQFEQGQRTTGLQIKKTLKEAASQKDERCASPNMFLFPEKEVRVKQSAQCKQERKDDALTSHSKMNVRDSIEVSRHHGPKKDVQIHKVTKQSAGAGATDFLAPIKHYKGDDCKLPNPVERDKQIRQLLGINRVKTSNGASKQNYTHGEVVGDHGPFNCFYKRNCEKNTETEVNLNDFRSLNEKLPTNKYIDTTATHIESAVERTSLYQQLILNRNIQVFLQIEQFTKQKPIILSRKQYDKVKRTIQRSVSKKISQDRRRKPICKSSSISVGEVRKRNKKENLKYDCNKQTQTDILQELKEHLSIDMKKKTHRNLHEKKQTDNLESFDRESPEMKTIVLFDSKEAKCKRNENIEIDEPKPTASNFEIHYASVEYMKHVTFSSTNVGSISTTSILRRNDSVFTIFKGRKRSVTPNLGTSDITLSPREVNSGFARCYMNPEDSKLKKPFLRRLISCLVMRSRTSDVKIPTRQMPLVTSVNSSVDSYHFSTSLGAVQMSSSLYDTTASFYTSHSVLPIVNSKMKRGFFNSVRGFLTNRKS